jgi:peptidoglycan/LPS O-acetylase OafA/YrhL
MQTSCGGRDDSLVATAAPPARARLPHQPALDGLRGLAVAGVLLFHGGHLQGGFLGVDAFFVLSGFLITSLLLVEAGERGRVSLGAFWARRARRLLPALACVLGAVALYAWLLARPDELATIRGDAFATIGYFANWRAIFNSRDYWSLFRSPSPLDHTWSLAIEEQFYLAWPLLVAVLAIGARGRGAARRVLVSSVALAFGSLAWTLVIFDPTNPSRAYFGTDTRVASILVGAALAAWLRLRGSTRSLAARGTLEVSAIGALALLATAWTRLSGSSATLYRGGLFVCALSVACVIAAAVHPRRGPVNQLFSFRPLRALGLISYGVYLWHWPIYVVLDPTRVHLDGWPLLTLRIAATLCVAIISYRFVEQPIRHGPRLQARSPMRPRALRVGVAFATAFAVVVAVVASTAAAPAVHVVVADRIRPPEPIAATPAHRSGPGVYKIGLVQDNVPRRVLVVGNSMALYAADEGFKQIHTSPPLDVLNLGSTGCRLLPEETRTRFPRGDLFDGQARVCRDNWAMAVSLFRPDVVVMIVSEPTDAEHEIDGHWTAPCEPAYDTVFERELHDQIRLLASGGAHVILTTTAYVGLPYKTPQWYAHNDCQNRLIRRVAAAEPKAVLADLFAWMCPRLDTDCNAHVGDIVLRPDGVHFRDTSARLLATWLIAQGRHHGLFKHLRVEGPEARAIATPPSP